MTPRKSTSSTKSTETATAARAKKTVTPKAAPEVDADAAYKQLALEWALRRGFDPVGSGMGVARRQVEKDPQLSDDVRRVLLERIDLMG